MIENDFITISKNIIRRRNLILIGMGFIILFNFLYFIMNSIIKGTEMVITILNVLNLIALIAYFIIYICKEKNKMFKSLYRAGRIIYLLPVLFYLFIMTYSPSFNYEFFAYSLLSLGLELVTFRFNLKDKNPLKVNYRCVIFGIIGILLVPIFLVTASLSPLDISITDLSRNLKYEVTDDGTLGITGVYSGLSKKVKIKESYYGEKITEIEEEAFANKKFLKKIYVNKEIVTIKSNAFTGVNDVYIYGAPTLEKNSLKGVKILHLLNDQKQAIANDEFFDGDYIDVPRNFIDDYRQMKYFSDCEVHPIIEDDEVFVNFDTDGYYVKTVIMKKNQVLDASVLKNNVQKSMILYEDTVGYENDNSYYQLRFDSNKQVLPYWVDTKTDNKVSFGSPLNESLIISPKYETISRYLIKYNWGEENDEYIYVSPSRSYVLPTIKEKARLGFSDLSFKDSNNSTVYVIDSNLSSKTIEAVWELEKPVITDFTNTTNKTLSRTYEKGTTTSIQVVPTHNLDVEYTYTWHKNSNIVSNTNALQISSVNQSGEYSCTLVAKFTQYGITYTSEVEDMIFVNIDRANPQITASKVEEVYDKEEKPIQDATIVVGEIAEFSYAYKGITASNVNYSSKNAPREAGSYKATISIPQTANYNSASIEVDVIIRPRQLDVKLYDNMTSEYCDKNGELDQHYKNNEAESITNQIDTDEIGLTLSGVSLINERYEAGTYPITATISNKNYTLHITNESPVNYIITKKNLTLSANSVTVTYGDDFELSAIDSEILSIDKDEYTLKLYTNEMLSEQATVSSVLGYYDVNTYYIGYVGTDILTKNYNISYTKNTVVIGKRDLTVDFEKTLTYNGANQVNKVKINNIARNHSMDSVVTVNGSEAKNAGSHQITIHINSLYEKNYNLSITTYDYQIQKKKATITVNGISKIYGEPFELSATINGIFDVDKSKYSLKIYTSKSSGEEVNKNSSGFYDVGTYYYRYIALEDLDTNYEITFNSEETVVVQKRELSVRLSSTVLTYNGIAQTKEVTIQNEVSEEVGKTCTIRDNVATNAGIHTINISINPDYEKNYLLSTNEYSFEIQKASLTIRAKSGEITYGETFENDVEYEGFVASESQSNLIGSLTYDTIYHQYDQAKTYTITPSGYSSTNYSINYVSGTLLVKKKTITIHIFSAEELYYEGTDKEISEFLEIDGVLPRDQDKFSLAIKNSEETNLKNLSAGEYILFLEKYDDTNYEFVMPSEQTINIEVNEG